MSNTNIHDALVAHKSPSPASAGVHFMHIKHRDGTDFPAVFAITCNTPQRHGKAEREKERTWWITRGYFGDNNGTECPRRKSIQLQRNAVIPRAHRLEAALVSPGFFPSFRSINRVIDKSRRVSITWYKDTFSTGQPQIYTTTQTRHIAPLHMSGLQPLLIDESQWTGHQRPPPSPPVVPFPSSWKVYFDLRQTRL